jgi:hypothetical protein
MGAPPEESLRRAIERRLRDVCGLSIAQLKASERGRSEEFVRALHAQAAGAVGLHLAATEPTYSNDWLDWDGDCLEALSLLSLGKPFVTRKADAPPVEPFLASLLDFKREPRRRFQLLMERYCCPPNIALDSELDVREHLLERLMVQDRAQVESGKAFDAEDVLLKLCLLSVYAARAEDLRYLDALNYYYELQPFREEDESPGTLPFIFLGLYARALSTWLNRKS